ncbi:twin-arginine translocation signal domain-containing protein [Oceanospirillum maris]|jgi:hypothetical protein|uniref:twin-arginine translocation signal domain-containing protein n=1 Tax=Oceanospirillum maris TaxID=64977 RepID=UPI0004053A8E|nr:twin-arginine translocation signal domain-containing protein [Oceanospirillum maris]
MSDNNNKVSSPSPELSEKDRGLEHAGRRAFLKKLTAGGALAGIAAVTASQAIAASPEPASNPQPEEKSGYRETDHIRTFYDTLR